MAIDIFLANSGNDIDNGSVVVSVPGLNAFEADDDRAVHTPVIGTLDDKYDDRFDDLTYYTTGS